MKTKNILISLAILCITAVSCINPETKKDNLSKSEDQTLTSILTEDDCFDEKIDRWFIKFNELQEEGYSMEDANTKAIADVALEFKTCKGISENQLANHTVSTVE